MSTVQHLCECGCGQTPLLASSRFLSGHNNSSRPAGPSLRERVFARLSVDSSGCLLWTGRLTSHGYAEISLNPAGTRRRFYVHRLMYEWFIGTIPDGLQIDHLCRVRACAAPSHLEVVTHKENILRGMSPMAVNARRTHCVNGHEFTPENTYLRTDTPGRCCRACFRDREVARRA